MHVYSVTPTSTDGSGRPRSDLAAHAAAAARRCESAGWTGILVPHNLHEVDPWLIAGHLGSVTERLVPLVAVQPSSMPPHTVALIAAAYASLHHRPLHFNLVAGARDDELRRTGDDLDHDRRYDRLLEFGRVLKALLRGERVDFAGEYYRYSGYELAPRPPVLAECKFFMAGSSDAGLRAAREIADVVVTHPSPFPEWKRTFLDPLRASGYGGEIGIRIGVMARSDREEAWRTARSRFPETRSGRATTVLKTRSSNVWAQELAARAITESETEADAYWLGAFRSGRVSAPFFVGDHAAVGARIAEYLDVGVGHVLLSGSDSIDDHENVNAALRVAAVSARPESEVLR